LLKKLDDLGIANNTIVMYSTDNSAELVTWPDGGTTPFHGEKGTTWEGGHRKGLAAYKSCLHGHNTRMRFAHLKRGRDVPAP
jgi:arylsulfatase A-like enzyme